MHRVSNKTSIPCHLFGWFRDLLGNMMNSSALDAMKTANSMNTTNTMAALVTAEPVDSTDAELVALCLSEVAGGGGGGREAFGRIVARYQTLVCSLGYSATGDLGRSEDIAQETFLTAWKELAKLREPEKLRSWLCGISRNLACDALRREGREPSHAAEALDAAEERPAPGPQPLEGAISREEQEILWRAMERIPEIYREPLILFYREHQSVEAVAQKLELNEDAVKQRLSRGRKLLQAQVLAFVEGALERTNPGKVFTLAVLAALSSLTISAKAAKTAAMGATAAKGGAAAKAAMAGGAFGAIAAPLIIFFGNYAGYRMSLASAHSDEERARIKTAYRGLLAFVLGYNALFFALIFWGYYHQRDGAQLFGRLIIVLVVAFIPATLALSVSSIRRRRSYLAGLVKKGLVDVSATPAWEYRSRASLLGLPLVHVCLGDRLSILKKPVTAWIAVGDCAVGGLFAFGGMAVAPLSIGGCAIGLLPFGGLALGVLVLGGYGVGAWTFGGMGIGWQSFGACVVAWKGAMGGIAIAHDFALGSIAQAAHVNDATAQQAIRASWFFRNAMMLVNYCFLLNLLWVVPLVIQWRMIVKRRCSQGA